MRFATSLGAVVLGAAACLAAAAQESASAGSAGSGSELEMKMFGKRLVPGEPVERGPLHLFNLTFVGAAYAISQQFREVLRVCRFRELDAQVPQERMQARDCQRAALTNLGRFPEAEQIALEDGRWSLAAETPSVESAQWWAWAGTVHMHHGNADLARAALNKCLTVATAALKFPPRSENAPLQESLSDIHRSLLQEIVRDAQSRLATIALHDQEFAAFDRHVRDFFAAGPGAGNAWAGPAAELAMGAELAGRLAGAQPPYAQMLPLVRADAGFRDVPEPLQRFDVNPAATPVLGEEGTQPLYARTWVRLAFVYRGLGRTAEAVRLLAEANALARRYVLEPANANTTLALVEEAQAVLAADRGDSAEEALLLASARSRRQAATVSQRSFTSGRRGAPIGSELLDVDARLLGAILKKTGGTLTHREEMVTVLEVLRDFSASRAELSAQLVAQALGPGTEGRAALLEQEGRLIDELVELKSAAGAGKLGDLPDAAGSNVRMRVSGIYARLAELKRQLGETADGGAAATRFLEQLGGNVYWQWLLHPYGNFRIVVRRDSVRIERIEGAIADLRATAVRLHESSALRDVSTTSRIPAYPRQLALSLGTRLFGAPPPARERWVLGANRWLNVLPWAALRVNESGTERWLIENHELVVAPSWAAWSQLEAAGPSRAPRDLLAVGDPLVPARPIKLGEVSKRGAYVASMTSVTEPELRGRPTPFGSEMRELAGLFPTGQSLLLGGPDATKQRLGAVAANAYKRLVFSTHGYTAGAVSAALGPALEMTMTGTDPRSRYLLASEVVQLRLDADVVVLSACDTSASDGFEGSEGYSGLVSAFLLAGSRSVMATLWPVETEATRKLVTGTFREMNKAPAGSSPASALRRSVLNYLEAAKGVEAHPYFWAALTVVGR